MEDRNTSLLKGGTEEQNAREEDIGKKSYSISRLARLPVDTVLQ